MTRLISEQKKLGEINSNTDDLCLYGTLENKVLNVVA